MRYLVGVIIGAIIGYITNWLAIKMLFKPHNEKRILGIKVPFTPGLIPKEKERMAKNVSESVGEHLLNRETVGTALKEPTVKVKVREAIENKIDKFLLGKGTVKERMVQLFGEKSNDIIALGEIKAKNKIIDILKEKNEEKVVSEFLFTEISLRLKEEPIFIKEFLNNIDEEFIIEKLKTMISKDKFYEIIENKIKDKIGDFENDEKLIGDIVPEAVFEAVDSFIINHKEEISLEICKTLRKETVSESIKEKIEESFFKGIKGIVTMFLSVDMVYDKLVSAVESYLAIEDNQKIISSYISSYIASAKDVEFEAFINNMPADLNRDLAVLITDKGTEFILEKENIEKIKVTIINYLDNFKSYDQLIKSVDNNYEVKLKVKIESIVDNYIHSDSLETVINTLVGYGKNSLLNYDFSNDIEKSIAAKRIVAEIIDKNYDSIVDREIPQILEIVDIPKIIEDQINSFEVDYAEKLIIDIANKELKAITWLGALLGGVLGILSPIIGSIKF